MKFSCPSSRTTIAFSIFGLWVASSAVAVISSILSYIFYPTRFCFPGPGCSTRRDQDVHDDSASSTRIRLHISFAVRPKRNPLSDSMLLTITIITPIRTGRLPHPKSGERPRTLSYRG